MIHKMIAIAKDAGQIILKHYDHSVIEFTKKQDNSELTKADLESNKFICDSLNKLYPDIPVLSEESTEEYSYDIRKNWEQIFLVDPLDGTKEFIKHNDEFSVNIALIKKDSPTLGVIHIPVSGVTYYAEKGKGAYKLINDEITPLHRQINPENILRVAVSRSHLSEKTKKILAELAKEKEIVTISAGSALKFGLIAEGTADVYVRNSPTMEWDTAAGQIIVNEVGKEVRSLVDNTILKYNKMELINSAFVVQ